ncbi:MAG: hypothetical protein CMM87_05715 [Rickettsiales bacterium]|nr:hypothetical protein [Rickettsiales bacterium]
MRAHVAERPHDVRALRGVQLGAGGVGPVVRARRRFSPLRPVLHVAEHVFTLRRWWYGLRHQRRTIYVGRAAAPVQAAGHR